ncbi:MAG: class I SAM-dependent RNA methyltransferase, partial [Lachnospiraceae bacterium]
SGTIPIEAAMMALNMAPGMNRNFTAQNWGHLIPKKMWYDCLDEANELIDYSVKPDIQGYDIDNEMIMIARQNAKLAGVEEYIHFQTRSVEQLSHPKKYGFLITNPPYGERIYDKDKIADLYRLIGERFRALDSWSLYMITAYEDAEKSIGRKADKNRKIYNGMMKTYYYQFMGPKPPKKVKRNEEEK